MISIEGAQNNRDIVIELNNFNYPESRQDNSNNIKEKDSPKEREIIISDGRDCYKSKLKFSIHEKTKEIMVEIIDIDTKEVIREIPPKKLKDLVANILEIVGLLIDKKA